VPLRRQERGAQGGRALWRPAGQLAVPLRINVGPASAPTAKDDATVNDWFWQFKSSVLEETIPRRKVGLMH
jgi:hypothetical protein